MNQTTGGQSMSDSSGAQSLAGSGAVRSNLVTGVLNWFEKYLLILVIEGLIAGIGAAGVSQTLVDQVNAVINTFMDLYGLIAPIAIFLILTPSLARLLANRKTGKFVLLVINWFALRKILASLWAIVFVLIVFRIPILPQGSLSLTDGISETVESLG
jgi:Na+/serine symporter